MKCASALAFLVLLTPGLIEARPVSPSREFYLEVPDLGSARPASGRITEAISPFGAMALDTTEYGGSFWAADSARWEAIRDSMWTFDSGVGSAIETGTNPNKPIGYHRLMEGWYGIDQTLNPLPYFRRISVAGGGCVLNGTFSLWAGATQAEANTMCFAGGKGYGNGWHMEVWKTFNYAGSGNATLSYNYAHEVEPDFDYGYVTIDTSGTAAVDDIELAVYTADSTPPFQTATITLTRGSSLRTSAGPVTIKFIMDSDGGYSDEDALYTTTCGAFTVDNISLTGAITDFTDFEAGLNGWTPQILTTGVGDFSNIVNRSTDLPPPVTFCACGVRDSVLVFYDALDQHPLDQDNIAASPWINLKRGGNTADLGRPGRLMMYDVYAEMPLANYIFVQIRARWYPSVCSGTGLIYRTPWRDQNVIFSYGEAPFCSSPNFTRLRDYSGLIETGAEQIQVAWGMINLCAAEHFGVCSGITNTTPWLDNIRLGIYGSAVAPNISLTTFDFFQDNFAQDGTLNPGSTGRIDTNTLKNASTPGPGSILRDTLCARGNGGNTEVRLVFHVRPGPYTQPAALAAWAARWTPEPALGAGWYSARMDTAEQGGTVGSPIAWMSCFHEADPGFSGTDRTPDPLDPSQNRNEILPDHVLTPGSRIDYFVAGRYLPPDPRNVGGTNWYVTPDTTGRRYAEIEILPSSLATDTTWNCALYVDHHHDRELDQQALEEAGLNLSLGPGSTNKEGTRYDRWDVQTPSSGQLSFGRPLQTSYGASVIQAFAYKMIVWHSGSLSSVQLTDEDASVIGPWLTLRGVGNNRFWGSGDGLATSMNGSGEPATVNFLRSTLGALRTCNTIRDAACPSGAALDSTYCLALQAVPGSEFFSTFPASLRGNGCPNLRSFDLLDLNSAVTTAKGQLSYVKNGAGTNFASVTNWNTIDVDYKTVLDGFGVGTLRGLSGNPHQAASCAGTVPATDRTDQVLDWFGPITGACRVPPPNAVPDPGDPVTPKYRLRLGNAHPNPMNSTARIGFEVPSPGARVTIELFDVTGRLVRTLADQRYPEGLHEIAWDGQDGAGRDVAAGLYFYRLTSGAYLTAKKIVVFR